MARGTLGLGMPSQGFAGMGGSGSSFVFGCDVAVPWVGADFVALLGVAAGGLRR